MTALRLRRTVRLGDRHGRCGAALGGTYTEAVKDAERVAAENVPRIRAVEDRVSVFLLDVWTMLWAE